MVGVPDRLVVIDVIAAAWAVIVTASQLSVLTVGVAWEDIVVIRLVVLLFVNVSVPAKVDKVPVVGRVTPVAPVEVRVMALAPAVISDDPWTRVRVAEVAGAVIVILLYVVAVATPSVGVTIVADVTLTTFPVPEEESAVIALVPAPNSIPVSVEAPVPPPETVRGVVSPVMDVMSLLAPEAARLAITLA